MIKIIIRILLKLKSVPYILNGFARPSYAQVGEDRILDFLFQSLNISKPNYLEIGTNHPIKCNNTYFFYTRGSRGVLVEPDPKFHSTIKANRPNDTLITSGVAFSEVKSADFYIYPSQYSGWNTFSREEVEMRTKQGIQFSQKIEVPLITINSILEKYFINGLDFLSVDIEGLDEEVLKSIDFEKYSPKIICVEMIRFGDSQFEKTESTIAEFLSGKGYYLYSSTHVNGIFVRNNI